VYGGNLCLSRPLPACPAGEAVRRLARELLHLPDKPAGGESRGKTAGLAIPICEFGPVAPQLGWAALPRHPGLDLPSRTASKKRKVRLLSPARGTIVRQRPTDA